MRKPIQRDEMPLQPQVLIEPFERWALDFVGPITLASKGKSYILVCVDYVTKWIEAKALHRAMEQAVAYFLYEDIFTHFGVPREIVTDQGTQFASKLIQSVMQQFKIKHRFATPYHSQANGQVESTEKVLEAILTKTVQQNHKDWVDRLLEALWTHKITWRRTTGFNPSEMVYGKKVLLPIKFQIKTFRTTTDLNLELTEAQK
jgi:transposase InsO family protein